MTQDQADELRDALRQEFGGDAACERVRPGRYRFEVRTSSFDDVDYRDRQTQVWAVVDRTLAPDAAADISLIMAWAPTDFDAGRQLRELEAALEEQEA